MEEGATPRDIEVEIELYEFRSWCEKNRPFLYKEKVWICNKAATVIHAALDAAYRRGMGREEAVRHVTNWFIAKLDEIGIDPFDVDRCDFQGLRDDVREVLRKVFPRARQAEANPLVRWKTKTPLREPAALVESEYHERKVPVRVSRRIPSEKEGIYGVLKKLAVILAILAAVFFALQHLPMFAPPASTPSASAPVLEFGAAVPSVDKAAVVNSTLRRLNEIRFIYGLPPVQYLDTSVAQFRADYVARSRIFSHYDENGFIPDYYWSKLGASKYGAMDENLFMSIDAIVSGEKIVEAMVYNDAASNWLHRASLLNPCATHVDVGVAVGEGAPAGYQMPDTKYTMYVSITMVTNRVTWITPPTYRDGVFTASGILEDGFSLHPVVMIYRYTPSRSLVYRSYYYEYGDLVAAVLPDTSYAPLSGVQTVYADAWRQSGNRFYIQFTYTPSTPGVYTIVILAKPRSLLLWPKTPNGIETKQYCIVGEYTFIKQ